MCTEKKKNTNWEIWLVFLNWPYEKMLLALTREIKDLEKNPGVEQCLAPVTQRIAMMR